MFYSYELLSRRCKGKLARCWLAATLSEQTFKRKYKLASIETIDVSVTCEEILNVIDMRNNTHYRFSLYLSSQLMFGITKIHLYQTKLLQDHLLEINCALFEASSLEEAFITERNEIAPSEVISIDELRYAEKSTDFHLITEEPYTSIVEHMMQDQLLNFGALSSFEVQEFLLMGSTELLNNLRTVPWDYSEETPAEPQQLPLADINRLEGESIRVEETGVALVRKSQEVSLIVTADQQPRRTPSTTPKKRTSKSAAETPTKRSRISLKDTLESLPPLAPPSAPAELAAVEVSEQVLAEVPAPEISEQALPPAEVPAPEIPEVLLAPGDALDLGVQQLPPIEDEEIVEARRNRRRTCLQVDKKTKLSNLVMQKWTSNVTIHTINRNTFTDALPSITQYLTQPSVKNCGMLWGKTLTKHYQQFLVKPVAVPNQFLNDLDNENEDTIQEGTIRMDKSNKLPNETTEISKHPIIMSENTTDPLKITITEFDVPEFPVIVENPTETEIPDTYEADERTRKSVSKSSYSPCSKTSFTKAELLALLEVHWYEGEFVKFHELIPPENYSKDDACCVFQYCLELHTKKAIVLKQAEPFDTLWIQKHFNDASRIDSSENVTV